MRAALRPGIPHRCLPKNAAVRALYRNHNKMVVLHGVHVVVRPLGLRWRRSELFTMRIGGGEKYVVIPHDGRGMAEPRDFGLPPDVFRLTPFRWRFATRGLAGGEGAPPLRPVVHPGMQRAAKQGE